MLEVAIHFVQELEEEPALCIHEENSARGAKNLLQAAAAAHRQTVRPTPSLQRHTTLHFEARAHRIGGAEDQSALWHHLVQVHGHPGEGATGHLQEPANVAAGARDLRAVRQADAQVPAGAAEVVEPALDAVRGGSGRRHRAYALHEEKADHGAVSFLRARPVAPVHLLRTLIVQVPPLVGLPIGLIVRIVGSQDGRAQGPADARAVGINDVGELGRAGERRAAAAVVLTLVLRVGAVAGQPVAVREAACAWRCLERQSPRMEHALGLVDVAVREVLDARVPQSVKVAERDLRQDRLHVGVVELEARADPWQIRSEGVVRVSADDRTPDVGIAKLLRAHANIVGLKVLQDEVRLPGAICSTPEEHALAASKNLCAREARKPRPAGRIGTTGDVPVIVRSRAGLDELAADIDTRPSIPVVARGVRSVGVKLQQLLRVGPVVREGCRAVAQGLRHRREVEASKAPAR
mmetsp:Transcript_99007/g.280426  ORF Transcript_99007/g.280426 Transcript_99007/m.280426 type:complete len:465 (-) Transcript_99007:331-1725(-)